MPVQWSDCGREINVQGVYRGSRFSCICVSCPPDTVYGKGWMLQLKNGREYNTRHLGCFVAPCFVLSW